MLSQSSLFKEKINVIENNSNNNNISLSDYLLENKEKIFYHLRSISNLNKMLEACQNENEVKKILSLFNAAVFVFLVLNIPLAYHLDQVNNENENPSFTTLLAVVGMLSSMFLVAVTADLTKNSQERSPLNNIRHLCEAYHRLNKKMEPEGEKDLIVSIQAQSYAKHRNTNFLIKKIKQLKDAHCDAFSKIVSFLTTEQIDNLASKTDHDDGTHSLFFVNTKSQVLPTLINYLKQPEIQAENSSRLGKK